MKKNIINKLLYITCAILVTCFIMFVIIDYSKYNVSYSAPFSTYVFIRALEFILPSIIIFTISNILK